MKNPIFISGSMDIKTLSPLVKQTLKKIAFSQKYKIFVGDAKGVDTLIQKECIKNNFFEVSVFSISNPARNLLSEKFNFQHIIATEKNARNRQQEKDIAMTKNADALLVIWDGKSRGSYENILRGLENGKKVEVFFQERFLSSQKITVKNITEIFEENRMFSASELISQKLVSHIKNVQQLQEKFLDLNILEKKEESLIPSSRFKNQISTSFFRGKKVLKYKKSLLKFISPVLKEKKSLF